MFGTDALDESSYGADEGGTQQKQVRSEGLSGLVKRA
jgi:hypothetical protein